MANPVKIEWSGYWDFPYEVYSSGPKRGRPISGEFPASHIILDSISGIDYSIDVGKIGMPKSPDCSFSLKNRDPVTGNELYPFNDLVRLGRTEHYGGRSRDFGDLYVRISMPILGDKTIFKGVVESFEYSPRNMEVKFNCTDFIGFIKDTSQNIFANYEVKDCTVQSIDQNTNSIASDLIFDGSVGKVDNYKGDDLSLEKITLIGEDVSAGSLGFATIDNEYNENIPYIPLSGGYPGAPGGFFGGGLGYTGTALEQVNAFMDDHQDDMMSGFKNQDFVQRFFGSWDIQYTVSGPFDSDGHTTNLYTIFTPWRSVFVKIGDSTILTQFRTRFESYVRILAGEASGTYAIDHIEWKYFIEIVHFNNGVSTVRTVDDSLIVMERGRFYKKADNISDAEIKEGDKLNINIVDYSSGDLYGRAPYDILISPGFGAFGHRGGIQVSSAIFIGGVVFNYNENNGILRASGYDGYFNNFLSLLHMLGDLIDHYTLNSISNIIFDTSGVIAERNQYCFVSDLIHYGWGDKDVSEIIVDTAIQIGSYLYTNEDGKITFKTRDVTFDDVEDIAIEIDSDDFELLTPTKYDYGSRYYSIEYNDKVELNNLSESEEVKITLDSNGQVSSTILKPQNIKVANYRTSDLAVPSHNERNSKMEVLRRSPILEQADSPIPPNYFIMHPVDQASITARTIGYPSEVFTIGLDVKNGESKGYFDIGIGSYLTNEGSVYLVKEINYNPNDIFHNSTSLIITLLRLGIHPAMVEFVQDDISISDSTYEDSIEAVFESVSDTLDITSSEEDRVEAGIHETIYDNIELEENTSEDVFIPPNTPTNLQNSNISGVTYVSVSWSYSGSNPDNFVLERSKNFGQWITVSGSIGGSARSFTDVGSPGGFSVGDNIRHRIKAVRNGAESPYSNIATITIVDS